MVLIRVDVKFMWLKGLRIRRVAYQRAVLRETGGEFFELRSNPLAGPTPASSEVDEHVPAAIDRFLPLRLVDELSHHAVEYQVVLQVVR